MELLVQTDHISKSFKKVKALDCVSLNLSSSEIVALLGPNGSGKTTFLKVVAGLLKPDSGSLHRLGKDVTSLNQTASEIGWMPGEDRSFYGRLTGLENLIFFGALQGLSRKKCREKLTNFFSRIPPQDPLHTIFQKCSTGMRQKLSLARCLIHDPKILLLDEPTQGLDPTTAKSVREYLKEWVVGKEKTVLWATHHAWEALEFASRVVFFKKGQIKLDISSHKLKARFSGINPDEIYERVQSENG